MTEICKITVFEMTAALLLEDGCYEARLLSPFKRAIEMDEMDSSFNAGLTAIESLVLSHLLNGHEFVCTEAYGKGVESAVESLKEKYEFSYLG